MIQGKYLYLSDDRTDVFNIKENVFHNKVNSKLLVKKDQINGNQIHAIAYANNIPVATGMLYVNKGMYYIDEIAVLKEEQGKGFGDFIVRMLIDKAFILGNKEIFVSSPSEMVPFFEKIGFEQSTKVTLKENKNLISLKICQDGLLKKCHLHK